jgi:hypothetical protein
VEPNIGNEFVHPQGSKLLSFHPKRFSSAWCIGEHRALKP